MDITKRNRLTDKNKLVVTSGEKRERKGQKGSELIDTKYYVQNELLI